jgi:hypothetical protein
MAEHYPKQNILKGAELEDAIHDIFKQSGYNVEDHKVTDSGLDVDAFKDGEHIVGECLHWYGGYIHQFRWFAISDNLLSCPSTTKYIFCVGVHPTEDQCQDIYDLKIHFIYGDTVADCSKNLRNQINGVITSEPETVEKPLEEPILSSYSFSSYADLELDYWNSLYSDLFS